MLLRLEKVPCLFLQQKINSTQWNFLSFLEFIRYLRFRANSQPKIEEGSNTYRERWDVNSNPLSNSGLLPGIDTSGYQSYSSAKNIGEISGSCTNHYIVDRVWSPWKSQKLRNSTLFLGNFFFLHELHWLFTEKTGKQLKKSILYDREQREGTRSSSRGKKILFKGKKALICVEKDKKKKNLVKPHCNQGKRREIRVPILEERQEWMASSELQTR